MRPSVLVVGGCVPQAAELTHLLEESGYSVRIAADGREALAAARQDPPLLIISDILIPGMDGYAFCREVKADATLRDIPVILVTVLSVPHDILKALECGADGFLRKPYGEQDLLSRLRDLQANPALRQRERLQPGVEIELGGQRHVVSAERRQIVDLLISSYEETVRLNEDLVVRQTELERTSEFLEGLYHVAGGLNRATSEQEVAESALEQALTLPGVRAGWIVLRESESGFRLVAARGLPAALAAPGAMEGDCLCRRQLLAGDLRQATNILECERVQRAQGDTGALRYHASIPLWVGDRTLGVMNLSSREPGIFRDEDLKVLSGVGNQVAIALERARLLAHLEDEVGRRTAALSAEVTERLRAEDARRRTEKLAAMGELLAGVAHELNNPLSTVLGQAFLLTKAAAGGPLATRAEKIVQAAERCARIVKNFLTLAREHPPERQVVQLNELVRQAVELLSYALRVDNVEVALDLADDLPSLWADAHQLHQILVNLLTNAHQAMRQRGPPRRLSIATRADAASKRISLEVSDTGPGIPPEIQARLFEPFFTTKPPGEGTGLGLSLCRGMVEAHGGTIDVESPPGRGARFRVELPAQVPGALVREVRPAGASPAIQGKAILVVDDEAEVAEVLAEMLSGDGHDVDSAGNGAVALEKLRGRVYDVVLSDLRMPELDGPGLYREVERRHPALLPRLIFLTGDTLGPEIARFLEETGAPRVMKPFTLDAVRGAIERVLSAGSG